MDFATIIGMLGAATLIAGAIGLGDSPMIFLNPVSLLIVFGGSLMVVLSQLRFSECRMALNAASRAFRNTLPDTSETIEEMLEVSRLARKGACWPWRDSRHARAISSRAFRCWRTGSIRRWSRRCSTRSA